ncbi:VOC family protein [Actinacidiphila epipremni]|uniref:Glyoxalase/bleomycin resistance/extradiol dioxygenase family protein n=1 Tax=Actinacidiphila epipremni TaxID=2053013 RepID=A0ABX0ZQ88_9ACTN|nr:VOC family protein [Actinacidiphila epipremni]NJP43748.1 glyoxalase/bleomycin resistance/extradiol dioxygenase family protein [Actinacidiphila epipremni]
MDALHPRLLVGDFGAAFRFYDAVLPGLVGARLARGTADGPYASWDVGDQGVLALIRRDAMAALAPAPETGSPATPTGTGSSHGTSTGTSTPAADRGMLVSRVPDVAAGYELCLRHGAAPVAGPADRPEWGPTMRTAHVRDPEGTLWELQSY